MQKRRWPLILFVSFMFFLSVLFFLAGLGLMFSDDGLEGRGDVAVVDVEGEIFQPRPLIRQLEKIAEREDIQAVVVRVDSPGGTVSASQELYRALVRLREAKKVVVSMGTVAASGGYYVACGANKIVANEGTITGSIGVRMNHVNFEKLFDWLRVEPRVLKSGRYKDIASPFRSLGKEEEQYLTGILKQLHEQFKRVVARERNLGDLEVEQITQGQIFSGEEAQSLGLVDALGSIQDAIDLAGDLAGVEGKPKVVYPKQESAHWMRFFMEGLAEALVSIMRSEESALAVWKM